MAGHKFGLDVEGNKRAARPPTETREERAARKKANDTFRARHYRGLTPELAKRNAEIIAEHAGGAAVEDRAEKYAVTRRNVRAIVRLAQDEGRYPVVQGVVIRSTKEMTPRPAPRRGRSARPIFIIAVSAIPCSTRRALATNTCRTPC